MNGNGERELSIEVTTHCNGACLHCFARAGISEPSTLPVALVKEIVAEGYDAGCRYLHITGGEPLLWEDLFDTLDYAFDLGYQTVFLNTNGTLLTEDVCGRLTAHDGLTLSVSLEGPEALHDRLRGAGSYNRTLTHIENVQEAGIDLFIFTTARKSVLQSLPRFADDLYKRFAGIKYLTLMQLIRVTDDVFDLTKELLEPDDFLKLVWSVSLLNLYGLKIQVLYNPLAGVASKLLKMPWIPQARTLHHDGSIIVMANRDITLSHSSRDSFGKYEPGMIKSVLASDEYRKAVAPDETTCPSCKYAEPCKENGMVRPSEWYRDMHPDVPYCKRVLDRVDI
jgi:MoaA/NifB/PqqE/SkfB family radical SAM enzyme